MNIIVLSRNPALYSTHSLVMAARRRGHNVRVIDHMRCDLVLEKNQPQIYYQYEKIGHVDAIIPRIGSTATEYGSAVIRQFELMGVFTAVRSGALLRSRDKLSCMQILAANNIGVPKSVVSDNLDTFGFMMDKIGEPMVVKLLKSTQGLGVILAENKNSAISIMEAFYKLKERVIAQEFIKEAGGADIRVFIVDDEIVGVMERQAKPGEFRSNLHRGASARVVELSDEEKEIALNTVDIMRMQVAGVDLLRSDKGPLIMEVNASPGLEGIESTTRVDIAGKIIQFVERGVRQNKLEKVS